MHDTCSLYAEQHRPWWQAPALPVTADQAGTLARHLIIAGTRYNPTQREFLWWVAGTKPRMTPYRRRVMSALTALSAQGGWRELR